MLAMALPSANRDSSAARSVQLADGAVDFGEAQTEVLCHDMVGERPAVGLKLHHLLDLQAALHGVPNRRAVAVDDHIDRAGGVAERTTEAIGAGRMHHPLALAHRLIAFVHGVDEHEVAAVTPSANAVDDQPDRLLEHDRHDIVGVGPAGEESEHVELWLFGRGGCGTGGKSDDGGEEMLRHQLRTLWICSSSAARRIPRRVTVMWFSTMPLGGR